MTLRWIRKRDGRRVQFDARKLAESIGGAARAAGEDARVPAEEIAEIAAIFLEKHFQERIPDTRELEDLVEKALLETGHARTADAYANRIKARARTREEIGVHRDDAPVAPDGEPLPPVAGERWSEGRIVASLERRRVAPALAEEVAAAVEQKLFGLGLKKIQISLVRELVNAELAERGLSARVGRPPEVAVPTEEVRALLVAAYVRRKTDATGAAAGGPEAAVGQDVLARFAIHEIYPPRVGEAHLEGAIHIQDLGRPLRLCSAALSLEALKGRPAAGEEGPRTAEELGAALSRVTGRLLATHARVIGIPYANVFLAPFAQGKEAVARRGLREVVRLLPATGERPIVRLHLAAVPAGLRDVPVLGPRGRRWKTCYGELAVDAERCGRWLVEAVREEGLARGDAPGTLAPGPVRIVAGVRPGEGSPFLDGAVAAALDASGLEPQRSRGLATVAELLGPNPGARGATPPVIAAGSASVVAVNCARAAYRAGRADEPALRAALLAAADLAVEAIAAKWAFLATAHYRPTTLPLWQVAGGAAPPPERDAVEAASATQTIALVGLEEALTFAFGEPPGANAAIAELAGDLVAALARRAREEGERRGLRVRLEEPELERASRRLADLDLARFAPAADILRLASEGARDAALRYSTGLGGALVEALYRPLELAPFVEGGELAEKVERMAAERAAQRAPSRAASS